MNNLRKHLLINISTELGVFSTVKIQIKGTLNFITYTKWKNLFGL